MNIEKFWNIIRETKETTGDNSHDMTNAIIDNLLSLEGIEICIWGQIFNEYQRLSYKKKLWDAAFIIKYGYCSDDSFEYFRGWLISQGKDVFINALENPDSLADFCIDEKDEGGDGYSYEEILSVAEDAYIKKFNLREISNEFYDECTKHPLPEEMKIEMANEITYANDIDVEWNGEGSLKKVFPRLCEIRDKYIETTD